MVTTGLFVPHQLPLKSFTLVPGAGSEPPDWRSTTPPYQLPEMALPPKSELAADCTGTFVPPLPSRNSMPTVQLLVMKLPVTTVLSVWFRNSMPLRL